MALKTGIELLKTLDPYTQGEEEITFREIMTMLGLTSVVDLNLKTEAVTPQKIINPQKKVKRIETSHKKKYQNKMIILDGSS